jgi:hypothetical protein
VENFEISRRSLPGKQSASRRGEVRALMEKIMGLHPKIPIWRRLRKAAQLPQVIVSDLAGLLVSRLDAIENGQVQPTDAERNAIWDVLVGPVKSRPADHSLNAALSENVSVVAKRQHLTLTSEQVQALATVIANRVTETLTQAFPEPPAGAEPEAASDGGSR